MLAATAVAFGLAAAGLLLIGRGLVGTTTPLAAIVAELHRPRTATRPSRTERTVTVLAGASSARRDAVAVGTGRAFTQLRGALATGQARREPPWAELGALGRRFGIRELEELHAAMTLAGGGAQVRESLTAKAAAITAHDLAAVEAEA